MATTTTLNLTAGLNTYYNKRLLKFGLHEIRVAQLGQSQPLPEGEGLNMEWFRYNEIPLTLTTGVVDHKLTDGTDETPTTVSGQKVTSAIGEYGAFSKHTKLLKMTHIDKGLVGVVDLWGVHAARTIELLTQQKIVANSAWPVRADLDTAKVLSATIKAATTPTTTSMIITIASGFGSVADDFNQSVIVITSGSAKGQARPIQDSTVAAGDTTVVIASAHAFDTAPAAGDSVHIVSPDALLPTTAANADSLNTNSIRRAVRILRANGTTPLPGGYFAGVLSPESEEGLTKDTSWVNFMTYKDTLGADGMLTGEIGRWGGVRWVRATHPFRFPTQTIATAGTAGGVGTDGINYHESFALASGEVSIITCNYVFGLNCFGVSQLGTMSGDKQPTVIIKNPGSQTVSQPLNRHSTVGYWLAYAATGLNPFFGVQIWSAEPGLGVI